LQRLSRYASALAFVSEATLISLGGELKRMESLSARLGDVLSELYFASAVVARYEHEGQQPADLPLAQWSLEQSFYKIEKSLDGVLANFPMRVLAFFLRLVILPYGVRRRPPSDALGRKCADLLLAPSQARDRLVDGIYIPKEKGEVALLTRAFHAAHASASAHLKQRKHMPLSDEEKAGLDAADKLVREVIHVNDFAAEELARPPIAP